MKWSNAVLIGAIGCASVSLVSLAEAQVAVNRVCPVENAQVTVSFMGTDTSVTAARAKLDSKMAEVKGLAQEQQFTKLVVQSHNYGISSNYYNGNGGELRYQYNGNISFSILPAEKAVDFMQMLAKKGYQTNVNVNSYNNGNCMQGMER